MKKTIINIFKFLLFLGTGLFILYLVYNSQNAAYQEECALKGIPGSECSLLQKVVTDFQEANYFWVLMVLAAFTLSNFSRAARWRMLIRPMGYEPKFINAFFTIVLGYFANLGLPRMGEVVRGATFAQYEKIPVEKVMGTIVSDRVIDVISILLVTGLALLLEFDTIWAFVNEKADLGRLANLGNLLLAAGAIGLAGLGLIYLFRKPLSRTTVYQKVYNLAMGFWQGIKTVSQLDRPFLFLLHSLNVWFMYFMMTYLCFFAFAPTSGLSAVAALTVFVFGGWGIVIPSPGGMGTYHFLAQTALAMYGISGDDGFSWANISFFSIQLGCNVLIGLLALALLPVLNRGYEPEPVLAAAPNRRS
ncbi:lysylphosphatidylglycerol synthase transmembrane domain-containing protein [Phaeodactylibacter luteus]|uniref:Flippase-like domain-containing protein n=1 Tax=Phaeodactylibacter luteus TaxID=1564516 RepID=A0A5C6RIS6_9BACT|nr:lysylphosphatidylglycerol synthase transmembrane domain-containing protein [Phaeodactylibacter luteus]TXB62023.1 flippase-like domain-containing protein [Phaeodactylibacter luteus]